MFPFPDLLGLVLYLSFAPFSSVLMDCSKVGVEKIGKIKYSIR